MIWMKRRSVQAMLLFLIVAMWQALAPEAYDYSYDEFAHKELDDKMLSAISFPYDLEKIDLSGNKMKKLDGAQFQHIKTLVLKNVPLQEMSGKFPKLEELYMASTSIESLDGANFPNIRKLQVNTSSLGSITGNWEQLRQLDLAENKLHTFEAKIPKARTASLRDNQLTDFDCAETKLAHLDLSRNKLTKDSLHGGKCSSLETVDLSYNIIEKIDNPQAHVLGSVTILFADHAALDSWDGSWLNLREVYMEHNRLTFVGAWVPVIEKMYLKHNKLVKNRFQPKPRRKARDGFLSFSSHYKIKLPRLKYLDLSFNLDKDEDGKQIKMYLRWTYPETLCLEYLNVDGNYLNSDKVYVPMNTKSEDSAIIDPWGMNVLEAGWDKALYLGDDVSSGKSDSRLAKAYC